MAEKIWTLTDAATNHNPDFAVTAADLGRSDHAFAIRKRRLQGGLQDGVDLIEVDNGRFQFSVLPTRGMGLWKGRVGELEVGWKSPVRGPVHPQFVPLADPSGLGWLDGFDELLCRCGLESNGAPEFDQRGIMKYPLHGRIANRPARHVELGIDAERSEIRLTGLVDETRFLIGQLQLRSTVITKFDEPGLRIVDEVTNLAATPSEAQMLYHINFGSPLLEAGAKIVAPVRTLVPRDARAVEAVGEWSSYPGPQAGFAEQVYFVDLWPDDEDRTHVLLKNARGDRGVSVGFDKRQLPCFTLWKNTGTIADGYVTGLEPGTNYPNPRSFEGAQGRVVKLAPGETVKFQVSITVHPDQASTNAAEKAIAELARRGEPQIFTSPQLGWTAAADG